MATTTYTDPILLDSTGQEIVTKLQRIADKVEQVYTGEGAIDVSNANVITAKPATTAQIGVVMPDGTTVSTDVNGVLSASQDNIADEFSTSTSYAVGDFVIYEGILYKCTTAHSGAWVAGDFTVTNVTDEIGTSGNTVTINREGTASGTVASYQRLGIDGVYTEIDGTKYMELTTPSSSSGGVTSFVFTNTDLITHTALYDIYSNVYGVAPTNVVAPSDGTTHTLTVNFNSSTGVTACRVYIRG